MTGFLDESKLSTEERELLELKCKRCGVTNRQTLIWLFEGDARAFTCEKNGISGGHEF